MSRLLLLSFLALASGAQARPWISLEGGRSEDYRLVELAGGGAVDEADTLSLDASLSQAMILPADGSSAIHVGELGLGVNYAPSEHWDLGLNGDVGRDSTGMRTAGGDLSLGLHAGEDPVRVNLRGHGGAMHYLLDSDLSLRQNRGGISLWLDLLDQFGLGASAGVYAYDRDLRVQDPGTPGTPVAQQPGFLGLVPPSQVGGAPGSSGSTQNDPLVVGFPARDWSVGVSVDLGHGALLSGDYMQSELLGDGVWNKVASASWRQELNDLLDARLYWSKSVEGGAHSPYFSLTLTWYLESADRI